MTQQTVATSTPKRTTLALPQATALIVGSIIGVGIFNLPGSLASYGPISLFAMALTTVGALALALLFASLSRRLPADGGPYAYARAAFGNLTGVKNMGVVQLWTSILKFVPLVFMSTVGLFFVSSDNFTPWNTSGGSAVSAIGGAMALCLFSYLGVETAAVAAAQVRDPDRNVPRATVMGTLGTAVVYLLSLFAVFGIVGSTQLGESSAPFSTAVNDIFGGTWAGNVMAALVVISGFGALNGWTMICAEMPKAAEADGLFPSRFGRLSSAGVPAFGIIASTLLASVAMVLSFWGSAGYTVFNTLVYMSGITAAIPYAFSALAQIKWRVADNRAIHTPRFLRDVLIAVVALAFSILFIFYSRNTGGSLWQEYAPFVYAGVAFLVGIPVYLAQRTRMTTPEPVPPFRP